jgi:hypothetical protein
VRPNGAGGGEFHEGLLHRSGWWRIDSRGGNVPRHLCRLRSTETITVGDPIVVEGKDVGRITSGRPRRPLRRPLGLPPATTAGPSR